MREGGDADRRLLALERVLERDLEIVAQVAAAGRARLGAPSGAHRAEHLLEYIGESARKAAAEPEIAGTATAVLKRGVAVPVIGGALLIVLQDVIGLVDFLEFLLGRLVARIAVRVMRHGQLAVGPLQLVGIGRFRYTEYFVKVPLCHFSTDTRP